MANVIEGAPIRHLERGYKADAEQIVSINAHQFNRGEDFMSSGGFNDDFVFVRKFAGDVAFADLKRNRTTGTARDTRKNYTAFLEIMFAALAGRAEQLAADLDKVRDGKADAAVVKQFTEAVACTSDIAAEWIELTKQPFSGGLYWELRHTTPTTHIDQIKGRAQEAVHGALERYLDSVAWLQASSVSEGKTKADTDEKTASPAHAQVDTEPKEVKEGTSARNVRMYARFVQMRTAAIAKDGTLSYEKGAMEIFKSGEFPGIQEETIMRILKKKPK